MKLQLGNWLVEVDMRALRPWSHFKKHRLVYNDRGGHIVWGKLSLHWEDTSEQCYPVCRECDSPDIGERSWGDESLTVCDSCETVEGGYKYVSLKEYEVK